MSTTIPIGNNIIKTGPSKGSDRETVLLGAEQVIVGVETDETEIVKNSKTGLFEERNAVVGQTIYNLRTQERINYLTVDLETGDNWDPSTDYDILNLKEKIKNWEKALEPLDPESEQYKWIMEQITAAKEEIKEIYNNHPAFIRVV